MRQLQLGRSAVTYPVRSRFILKCRNPFLPQAQRFLHIIALVSHTEYLVYGAELAEDGAGGREALKLIRELPGV